jgi:hypothetical protein
MRATSSGVPGRRRRGRLGGTHGRGSEGQKQKRQSAGGQAPRAQLHPRAMQPTCRAVSRGAGCGQAKPPAAAAPVGVRGAGARVRQQPYRRGACWPRRRGRAAGPPGEVARRAAAPSERSRLRTTEPPARTPSAFTDRARGQAARTRRRQHVRHAAAQRGPPPAAHKLARASGRRLQTAPLQRRAALVAQGDEQCGSGTPGKLRAG